MDIQSVPDDRLIQAPRRFDRPSLDHVRTCFHRIHGESERAYRGDGVWGDSDPDRLARLPAAGRPLNVTDGRYPPLYRNTAWRIIGYAAALEVEADNLYRERVFQGGEYLLREQQPDGTFLYWRGRTDGWPTAPHLLFCSANPGCALVALFRLTGDSRYLDASRRAADWSAGSDISPNTNYNSFAVWHLCEHYRETGEARYLESALDKTLRGVYPRQLENGAWAGHNAWVFYHAIIVRGLAALYGLLPDTCPEKPGLRRHLIRAVNHLIQEQGETGALRSCFDPLEWQESRKPESAYSVHPEEKVDPFSIHALACVQEQTDLDVRSSLYGLLSTPPRDELVQGQEGMMHLAYGVGYRWLARDHREGDWS